MRNLQGFLSLLALVSGFAASAQNAIVSGKVTDKLTGQSLEYATVTFSAPGSAKAIAGGITDPEGNFSIAVPNGTYDITTEFIGFMPQVIRQRAISGNTSLGTIILEEEPMMLDEVVVRVERTTVDIRLDKKVYNVGQDLMVKGGTVSDVLDNIPSVTVDSDGAVSLRGNDNVRILIDGKPSNAINVAEALRLIPADAIDKVEVVTNPSARYDSEGGGGLLNIILKKGKSSGVNGTFIASAGDPEHYGLSGNLNLRSDKINVFTTTAYNYRNNPGNSMTDTEYLFSDGSTRNFIDERSNTNRLRKGFNSTFGFDWYIDPSLTWTNRINLRKNKGEDLDEVRFANYDANRTYLFTNERVTLENSDEENFEFATNVTKDFDKEGHRLTIDAAFSVNQDDEFAGINQGLERTLNLQDQNRSLIQADYVRPIGEDGRFEAGYKGEFNRLFTDYRVEELIGGTSDFYLPNYAFTNKLEYKEKINAVYAQYGSKINNFSYLLGLRWEDSNIDVNQFMTQDYNNKRYNNFFPSVFLTYELADESNVSLSYSRRISRPRGRMINPFSNYSSNINLFAGNPDLDPALSDAFDLGYLKRWQKLTLSASMYLNRTSDAFQFIRRESGDFVIVESGDEQVLTPVILSTPINLGVQYRAGFEFTLNYSPYRWWRLNSNFNLFRNETQGDYTYTTSTGETITDDFDNIAYSWFSRVNSKITLPYGIDWQLNVSYFGPQDNAQGRSKGIAHANTGISKDLFKDKATLALNVQDVFNSRKRIYETHLPGRLNSYSEFQWRERQVTLSFTYRFNKPKNEREREPRGMGNDMPEEFPG